MKIRSVRFNNKKKDFQVASSAKKMLFLMSKPRRARHRMIQLYDLFFY